MKQATFQDYKRRLLRVLVHIQAHLDDPLPLDDLARLAAFSPFHFHHIFTGMLGESIAEHIRRLRLERAASRLKLTSVPVTELAFDAGYQSLEAFTRSFRAAFGLSPSEFRLSKKRRPVSPAVSNVHFVNGQPLSRFKTLKPADNSMKVTIQYLEPIRVAFLRHIGPYATVSASWDKFLPFLGKEGLLGADSQFIGICHDDPDVTPADKIRYDACVSVDGTFVPGDLGVQIIPGGDYAMTTQIGPYQKLGQTYAALLGQWLPRSGRQLRSTPCFDMYLNDPQSTDPEDLITDIYAPLEPRNARALRPI